MWFIVVEVEQETNAPPPKKNPGSAPAMGWAPCGVLSFNNHYTISLSDVHLIKDFQTNH